MKRLLKFSWIHLLSKYFLLGLICYWGLNVYGGPTISNIRASQRTGTKLVDLYYDLQDIDPGPHTVGVEISGNGGVLYDLIAADFTGDVGSNVTPGANKHVIWDAGKDWNGGLNAFMRFRITACGNGATPLTYPGDMVWIPGGTFTMGSPATEADRSSAYETQTIVTLTRGFFMAKYETTQRQYVRLINTNPSSFRSDIDLPVESLDWMSANAYCSKLTFAELSSGRLPQGWIYRLPTNAEWEYACRAGTTNRFFFGDDDSQLSDYAWYNANAGKPQVVGQKKPNQWGLYDMYGNVSEWCLDLVYRLPGGHIFDPFSLNGGNAIRGGSFIEAKSQHLRSAATWESGAAYHIGFRVVLAPDQPLQNPYPDSLAGVYASTYTMGSPAGEQDRKSNEGPQTTVTLTHSFYASKYEVTQNEYVAIMGNNPSLLTGDSDQPVDNVTWFNATNYCFKLTQARQSVIPPGYVYRLPTEAEWEFLARGFSTNRFNYGGDPAYSDLGNYAWVSSNSGGQTHKVGQKSPNSLGLYDMSGNLGEWCLNWYAPSLPTDHLFDPNTPSSGTEKIVRGGDWSSEGKDTRSASRASAAPDAKSNKIGFRVVLALPLP